MTEKINAIAQRFGVQLTPEHFGYTTTTIYTGDIPPNVLAYIISRAIYADLRLVLCICVLTTNQNMVVGVYSQYNPAKEHPDGVKGSQRPA